MTPFTQPDADLEKTHAEIVKLIAETRKLNAEAGKMSRETFWYPVAIATALITAVATITALVINRFSGVIG